MKQSIWFRLYVVNILFLMVPVVVYSQDSQVLGDSLLHQKTDEHERIKGSNVFVKVPDGFKFVPELMRYQHEEKERFYFQLINIDGVFDEYIQEFNRASIESTGAVVDTYKQVALGPYRAVYTAGPSKFQGETKVVLIFGDSTKINLLAGVVKTSDNEEKAVMLKAFSTVYFDSDLESNPLELANFSFEQQPKGFKFLTKAGNMFMYGLGNEQDLASDTAVTLMVATMPAMTASVAKEYAKSMLWRYELNGASLHSKEIVEVQLSKYKACVLESTVDIQGADEEGFLYKAIIVGKSSCVILLGSCREAEKQGYLEIFRRAADNIIIH